MDLRWPAVSLALGFLFALPARLPALPVYSVQNLGNLGGSSATAYRVNESGQVAGYATLPGGDVSAFLYSGGSMAVLAPLDGYTQSMAYGLNNSGLVAGSSNGLAAGATTWTGGSASAVMQAGSYGTAVNDAGQVAGGAIVNSRLQAFDAGPEGVTSLGVLPGGDWSSAYDINASGQVAGYGTNAYGRFQAFLWGQEEGMQALPTLGGTSSYAMALNDAGWVTGASTVRSGYLHAFLYDGHIMRDLGTLGGGLSSAYDVDNQGQVVGYSFLAGGAQSAFLYTGGVLYDLNQLLAGDAGWLLTAAYGINDKGQIAGSGYYQGQASAFLLNPIVNPEGAGQIQVSPVATPEPGTWLLLGGGLILLLAVKRWRTRCAADKLGIREARRTGSHKRWKHPDGRAATIPIHRGRVLISYARWPPTTPEW